jgi:hypothetical protein
MTPQDITPTSFRRGAKGPLHQAKECALLSEDWFVIGEKP